MPENSFIERAIDLWLKLSAEVHLHAAFFEVKRSPDGTKAAVEIEASGHTATIELWERLNCLDTTILARDAEVGRILAAGPCANWGECESRLQALREALLEP